jgi:hypothetical protein
MDGYLLEQFRLRAVSLYFLSFMSHVSCPFYPFLDLLTNLQTTDHEIPNYAVLFCLPFLVCIQAKQGQYFLDDCSLKS